LVIESAGPFISPRAYFVFRKKYVIGNKTIYHNCSISNEEICPDTKEYVRSLIYFQSYIIETDPQNPNLLKICFTFHTDPSGSIRAWAANGVIANNGIVLLKTVKNIENQHL
jgi:hypothetical protein